MTTISINDKVFQVADLSPAAAQQLLNIQFVEAELVRIQQQQAVLLTAKNAYVAALQAELDVAEPEQSADAEKKSSRARNKKA